MRMIHAFGQEGNEQQRFARNSGAGPPSLSTFPSSVLTAVHPLLEFLYIPMFLGVFFMAWQAEVGLSTVLAFLLLLYRVQPHLKTFDSCRVQLNNHAGVIFGVANQLDQEDDASIRNGTLSFNSLSQDIRFDRVSFCYHGNEVLSRGRFLRDTAPARSRAIVGRSGAGKSTLINLLYGFYNPNQGENLSRRAAVDGV